MKARKPQAKRTKVRHRINTSKLVYPGDWLRFRNGKELAEFSAANGRSRRYALAWLIRLTVNG